MSVQAGRYRLGRLTVSFEGDEPVAREVAAEFNESLPVSPDDPHLRFVFVRRLPGAAGRGGIRIRSAGPKKVRIDLHRLHCEVNPSSRPLTVTVAPTTGPLAGHAALRQIRRALNWNHLDPNQELAKHFIYDVFDWTAQIVQLDHGQSFMHASAMTRGDRSLAVLGGGGVGKTSIFLHLCVDHGWRYLSDDLGLTDQDGTLYRAPKRLQIYAYNLRDEPRIARRVLSGRSTGDILAWTLHRWLRGPKRVRRRMAAERLLGVGQVAQKARLTDLVFLEKMEGRGCVVQPGNSDQIAALMAGIVMQEIEPYGLLCRRARDAAVPFDTDPIAIENRTRDVLARAFRGARSSVIRIGRDVSPRDLSNLIIGHIG